MLIRGWDQKAGEDGRRLVDLDAAECRGRGVAGHVPGKAGHLVVVGIGTQDPGLGAEVNAGSGVTALEGHRDVGVVPAVHIGLGAA